MDHEVDRDSSDCDKVRENESEGNEDEVQKIESTLIAKPKTKSDVKNFFCIESDSDGHLSNTNTI